PVYRDVGGALAVIGVVSWSTGPALSEGCGGRSRLTPLPRPRAGVGGQTTQKGAPLPPPVEARGEAAMAPPAAATDGKFAATPSTLPVSTSAGTTPGHSVLAPRNQRRRPISRAV